MKLEIGDRVRWKTPAGKQLEGVVIAHVNAGDTPAMALARKCRAEGMTVEEMKKRYDMTSFHVKGALPREEDCYLLLEAAPVGKRGKPLRSRVYCPRLAVLEPVHPRCPNCQATSNEKRCCESCDCTGCEECISDVDSVCNECRESLGESVL